MNNHIIKFATLYFFAFCSFTAASLAGENTSPSKPTADSVLLVYNANSPISQSVAEDYAQKRSVTRVLSIQCVDSAISTPDESISYDTYTNAIETPVQNYLLLHPEIQFIVLTKGVPLRVVGAETGERPVDSDPSKALSASVDSHLAAIDYKTIQDAVKISITGSGATGVGWSNRYWNANEPFSHAKFGGYLVTRLDGYTEADAKSLVTRALAAEQGVVRGTILLDTQPIFGFGPKTYQSSAD